MAQNETPVDLTPEEVRQLQLDHYNLAGEVTVLRRELGELWEEFRELRRAFANGSAKELAGEYVKVYKPERAAVGSDRNQGA